MSAVASKRSPATSPDEQRASEAARSEPSAPRRANDDRFIREN
jgi:hypothetical protein